MSAQVAAPTSFEFYFDFSSPFAYLASTQIEALERRTGARAVFRPFLLGALFRAIGTPDVPLFEMPSPKRRHAHDDLFRWADHLGVLLRWPSRFPMVTVTPLRLALAAGDALVPLTHRLFRAYWVEDRDISDDVTLESLLAEMGLPAALLARARDAEVKDRLRAATAEAVRLGACGAPTFVVGDMLFWGQDRLPLVERALLGWRPACG